MVGCNMRFHPGPARVKQLLEAGAIGRVIAARIVTGSYLPDWRPGTDYRDGYSASAERGGGAILDCIHEIDLSLWYLGPGTVVGAAAVPARSIGLQVEGLAEILIRHDSGALSSVHLNFVERGYRRTCRFLGSEGAISWDFEGGGVVWQGSDGRARARYERPDDWCVNSMYVDEMKHFLECVSARTTPQGTLEEGSRALGIALGARRMASEGWNHAE
jgi:predicted dehydrogenase